METRAKIACGVASSVMFEILKCLNMTSPYENEGESERLDPAAARTWECSYISLGSGIEFSVHVTHLYQSQMARVSVQVREQLVRDSSGLFELRIQQLLLILSAPRATHTALRHCAAVILPFTCLRACCYLLKVSLWACCSCLPLLVVQAV